MFTILVTGANRGIGFGLVNKFYTAGWKVLACCRNPATATALQNLAATSKQQISIYKLDVTDEKSILSLAKTLKSQSIDILYNNAGIGGPDASSLHDLKISEWIDVFKANTFGPFLVSRALVEQVKNSKLKIIANMSSILGSIALNNSEDDYIYRSSKTALNSIVKCLANDLKAAGVTVIALHPGWVRTDMGGPSGEIDATTSAAGLFKVLNSISIRDTGRFLTYRGKELKW